MHDAKKQCNLQRVTTAGVALSLREMDRDDRANEREEEGREEGMG